MPPSRPVKKKKRVEAEMPDEIGSLGMEGLGHVLYMEREDLRPLLVSALRYTVLLQSQALFQVLNG